MGRPACTRYAASVQRPPSPVFAGCCMGGEVTFLFLRFGVVVLSYFRIQWFIITMKNKCYLKHYNESVFFKGPIISDF